MCVTAEQHCLQVFGIPVHGTGNKTCISTHSKCQWIKRMINTSERSDLVTLFSSDVGEYCPLVKP